MKRLVSALVVTLACVTPFASAQNVGAREDVAAIREIARQFLATQASGLPGQVAIKVGAIDSRANLAACAAPQAFFPAGSRAWGKTTVGVRCTAPVNWTLYISAKVQVIADYLVTAKPLVQGQPIGEQDVARLSGDLTMLPPGVITATAAAIGRTLAISLPAGVPLREDVLRSQQAVQQGQMVKLVNNGPGFSVSSEARALNNAVEGQVAQARTASGQVVSGIAHAGGVVTVTY